MLSKNGNVSVLPQLLIGRVSYLIYVSMGLNVLTTSGDIVMFSYGSVFELLIC